MLAGHICWLHWLVMLAGHNYWLHLLVIFAGCVGWSQLLAALAGVSLASAQSTVRWCTQWTELCAQAMEPGSAPEDFSEALQEQLTLLAFTVIAFLFVATGLIYTVADVMCATARPSCMLCSI